MSAFSPRPEAFDSTKIGSVFVYDLETTSVDPTTGQILQMGIQRFNANLDPLDEGKTIYVGLRPDVMCTPGAALVHGIPPDVESFSEYDLATAIGRVFTPLDGALPNIIAGYNNIGFDDEWLRHLMYRNLYPAYDHEWRGGNKRFDVHNAVRFCRAFAPNVFGPIEDTKLSSMAAMLGIDTTAAHDALGDVVMTAAVMRRIKEYGEGRVWEHLVQLCDRRFNEALVRNADPFWAAASTLSRRPHGASLLLPLGSDINNDKRYYCADLSEDPTPLLEMSPGDLRHYLFMPGELRTDNMPHIPLVRIDLNRMPCLAPTPAVAEGDTADWNRKMADRHHVDLERVQQHLALLDSDDGIVDRIRATFDSSVRFAPSRDYAYGGLYECGFISDDDAGVRSLLRGPTSREDQRPSMLTRDLAQEFSGSLDLPRQYELALRQKWGRIMGMPQADQERHVIAAPAEAMDYAEYLAKVYAFDVMADAKAEHDACMLDATSEQRALLRKWETTNLRQLDNARAFYTLALNHMDKVQAARNTPQQQKLDRARKAVIAGIVRREQLLEQEQSDGNGAPDKPESP